MFFETHCTCDNSCAESTKYPAYSVTEARTNLCAVSLQRKKHAPLTVNKRTSWRMRPCTTALENCHLAFYGSKHGLVIHSITQRLCQRRFNSKFHLIHWFRLSGIRWIRVDYHRQFYYFNCYQVFSSNPENPGFCPHKTPGLRVSKSAGLPGFSGARVPGLHSLLVTAAPRTRYMCYSASSFLL